MLQLKEDPLFIPIFQLEKEISGGKAPTNFSIVENGMRSGLVGSLYVADARKGVPSTYFYAALNDSEFGFAFSLSPTDEVCVVYLLFPVHVLPMLYRCIVHVLAMSFLFLLETLVLFQGNCGQEFILFPIHHTSISRLHPEQGTKRPAFTIDVCTSCYPSITFTAVRSVWF